MTSKPTKQPMVPPSVMSALEMMRGHLVELEAVAHAAEEALQHLPYVPPPASQPGGEDAEYTDKQLGPGRLQTMVVATSAASRLLLREIDRLLELVQAPNKSGYKRSGHGSSRASEDWDLSFLLPSRAHTLIEPS